MPFFDYECKNCNNKFSELVKNFDEIVKCPKCGEIAKRDYNGEVFAPDNKKSHHCSGNCKTCGGCR